MLFDFVIDRADVAICFILFCVVAYFRFRRKQRRLVRMRDNIDAEIETGGNALDDGFYCIMRKDGTTSAGFIRR